jgi:SAM-dependent methyltransferase
MECKVCQNPSKLVQTGIWDCDETKVFNCTVCGVFFLDPFINDEEEKDIYGKYEAFITKRYSGDLGNLYKKGNEQDIYEFSLEEAEMRFNHISEHIKGDSLLEVGPGYGGFLGVVKKYTNLSISIAEPSKKQRDFISNKFKPENTYSDYKELDENEKYDTVVAFQVFEHIREPLEFANKICRNLKEGGLLILEMPSAEDPLLTLYDIEEFKRFYFQKQHIFIHSVNSLRFLKENSDFGGINFIRYQRYSLDNHLSWLLNRKRSDYKEQFSFLSKSAREAYNDSLVKKGISDTIVAIFEK